MPSSLTNSVIDPPADAAARIRGAWAGRVTGCMLGKPVEVLSFEQGRRGLKRYLEQAGAWPLRSFVPLVEGSVVARTARHACRDEITRAEPDDDINYTVLALMLLEEHGADLTTEHVARAWIRCLPAGATWTAERAAYRVLLERMHPEFVNGAAPGFDLAECSAHEFSDWIGAQIRADLYGWVCPGRPALAAGLAARDAALSHRDEGVHGAMFIAALGAIVGAGAGFGDAIDRALAFVPGDSDVAAAVHFGCDLAGSADSADRLHEEYADLSPVHVINNLALVVSSLCAADGDFGRAIGDTVAAGWDTDSNAATVGGLLGLSGLAIDPDWTSPWNGRIGVTLAGVDEFSLDELTARTIAVMTRLGADARLGRKS